MLTNRPEHLRTPIAKNAGIYPLSSMQTVIFNILKPTNVYEYSG